MVDSNSHTRGLDQKINTWVQTIGIVVAAVWAAYTFVYKEYFAPRAAPVNISLNLQLKKLGGNEANKDLIAVELKAAATNPSTREIHLLPNVWIAYGISMTASKPSDDDFLQYATETLATGSIVTAQRHAEPSRNGVIVAVGHLFGDTNLKPNENTGRTIVFYIPRGAYDVLDVIAFMPCARETKSLQLEWGLKDNGVEPNLYRVEKGKRERLALEAVDKKLELQTAQAAAEISLWP